MNEQLELHATLDEKRAQLASYRQQLHNALQHRVAISELNAHTDSMPERSRHLDDHLSNLIQRHAIVLQRTQQFVEQYEAIVADHQQYSKAVMDMQEWMEATNNAVLLWGDSDLERLSIRTNLERLRSLQLRLPEETPRLEQLRILADKVLPGTVEHGQQNIRAQVDASQQEWEGLVAVVGATIEALEAKLQQWTELESSKEQTLAWLRDTDVRLHGIELKATLEDKRGQLATLKVSILFLINVNKINIFHINIYL